MAFSMFFKTSACSSRVLSQQLLRMATQPSIAQRAISSTLPVRTLAIKEAKMTPILNAVRSFRTSAARFSVEKGHDHSKLWIIEKSVAGILLPLIPMALLMPNKLLDSVVAVLLVAHSFWGLEAIVVEYFRVLIVGIFVQRVMFCVVYTIACTMLGGLFWHIFNGNGFINNFWKLWNNMRKPPADKDARVYVREPEKSKGPRGDRC